MLLNHEKLEVDPMKDRQIVAGRAIDTLIQQVIKYYQLVSFALTQKTDHVTISMKRVSNASATRLSSFLPSNLP
jgi:hypothetical protein